MSIGSRIKEAREAVGLTQEELAELMGVSKGTIGNYETDGSYPRLELMKKLFEYLHTDANYIFQDLLEPPEVMRLRMLKMRQTVAKGNDASPWVFAGAEEVLSDKISCGQNGAAWKIMSSSFYELMSGISEQEANDLDTFMRYLLFRRQHPVGGDCNLSGDERKE